MLDLQTGKGRQFINISTSFAFSSGIGSPFFCVRSLRIFWFFSLIFDNFFQVSFFRFSFAFERIGDYKIFWSSLPTFQSDLLFRYVSRIHMHWITRDKTWMKRTERLCGWDRKVWSFFEWIAWSKWAWNQNSSLRIPPGAWYLSKGRAIILNYASSSTFVCSPLWYCSWWRLN